MWIEILGITATVFVLISFLMKEAARIRKINIIGAFLFVVYGVLINSISVWLLNGVLLIVHIYHLRNESCTQKSNYKKLRRKKWKLQRKTKDQ